VRPKGWFGLWVLSYLLLANTILDISTFYSPVDSYRKILFGVRALFHR
jgi:hypothetical protein